MTREELQQDRGRVWHTRGYSVVEEKSGTQSGFCEAVDEYGTEGVTVGLKSLKKKGLREGRRGVRKEFQQGRKVWHRKGYNGVAKKSGTQGITAG